MSEKVKIRKVSDWWGDYDCSSARNYPKLLQWLSRDTQDPYTMSVYVDNSSKTGDLMTHQEKKLVGY